MSENFEIARKNMVVNQLRPNKIKEENILNLFKIVPKENYLNINLKKNCYLDKNLDLNSKRGYLKNLHLAQLIKYSQINEDDKVLHIGGLTGYFSVLLSLMCKDLYVIEDDSNLFNALENNILNSGRSNIKLYKNKLIDGWQLESPFNLIIIDGPIFRLNKNLKDQISDNSGRLVYIKKINDNLSKAYKLVRNGNLYSSEFLFDVMTKYQIQDKEREFNF
ncbi:MAG: hypothetical protein CBD97_02965 [Pelagibacteraceae bacterium TMED237]|nr:MAG: hypothetical protein CBD97_02965 [Pelagibacteraceae bacterium TMED237]